MYNFVDAMVLAVLLARRLGDRLTVFQARPWPRHRAGYLYPRIPNKIPDACLKSKGVRQEGIMINDTEGAGESRHADGLSSRLVDHRGRRVVSRCSARAAVHRRIVDGSVFEGRHRTGLVKSAASRKRCSCFKHARSHREQTHDP